MTTKKNVTKKARKENPPADGIEPEPPTILKNIKYFLELGKKNPKVIALGILFVIATSLAPMLVPPEWTSPKPTPTIDSPGALAGSVTPPSVIEKPLVIVVDSRTRRRVIDEILDELESMETLYGFRKSDRSNRGEWLDQARDIGSDKPRILVIHWHAFRGDFENEKNPRDRDWMAEERLIQMVEVIKSSAPQVRVLVYSSSFAKQDMVNSERDVQNAAKRVEKKQSGLTGKLQTMSSQFVLIPWSDEAKPKIGLPLTRLFARSLGLMPNYSFKPTADRLLASIGVLSRRGGLTRR
ncbi:MAG: hypothetical protein R3F15_18290 [Lysobacterales bacterium]